jgi:hypothetical protein
VPSTPAVRTIGLAERRARLATRDRLVHSRRSGSVVEVVRDLGALHAIDLRAWCAASRGCGPGRGRRTQRRDDEVVTRLLADLGTDAARAVASEAHSITTWLGPARVTPQFRTPLERALVGAP